MPKLDVRGDLEAAVIAFYFPILILTFVLTARYGFSRDAGWMFLFTFSMVRITGAALLIAAELIVPPSIGLYTGAYILESAGLSPLLLATIGFLGLVGQNAFSESPRMSRVFRIIGLLALAALALTVAGGIESSSSNISELKVGKSLREAGIIVFAVVYGLLVIMHVVCWSYEDRVTRRGRNLLIGITLAVPFLGVRVAYAILSVYSASRPNLARFNSITGNWRLYLVMSLIMEYIVVVIYAVVGAVNTPQKRYR